MPTRRYALYGGTFDPFHAGHLAVARAALASGQVDEVLIIPGGTPPHRGATRASVEARWCMAVLGVLDEPGMRVVRWETDRAKAGRTYAVDTAAVARAELGPEAELAWVIGADAMADIHTWHEVKTLFERVRFLVAPRDGHGESWLQETLARVVPWASADAWDFMPMPESTASSTAVRTRLLAGDPATDLLPPLVARYVARYHPYRPAEEGA